MPNKEPWRLIRTADLSHGIAMRDFAGAGPILSLCGGVAELVARLKEQQGLKVTRHTLGEVLAALASDPQSSARWPLAQ